MIPIKINLLKFEQIYKNILTNFSHYIFTKRLSETNKMKSLKQNFWSSDCSFDFILLAHCYACTSNPSKQHDI